MKQITLLKEKTSTRNTLSYTDIFGQTIEVGFSWKNPASEEEINEFESSNNIKLPKRYKEFLKVSNGAVIYEDIEDGGSGYRILGLTEILESTKHRIEWGYDLKDYCIVFAEVMGNSDFLLFDLKKSEDKGNDYIIDGDTGYPVDEWEYVKGDFFHFINRLITTNGSMYWRWY
ncbi:SMI1/KNR4 family protein [Clostridium estertheticum]|uniref:SMI1/KNR4 family protein n=1 Tax=Clostridium estertheticum TaxID=238834 RepID=UPI001C7D63E1|nr:SMI1/KNR4 family protein [Clostridium estertheticum]MBX4262816.1 SMI1/KNR4 family protein [Clostridium estertheticum]WLC72250.1 SMI1/KNR4 family protein [Clostridium estertheticum]